LVTPQATLVQVVDACDSAAHELLAVPNGSHFSRPIICTDSVEFTLADDLLTYPANADVIDETSSLDAPANVAAGSHAPVDVEPAYDVLQSSTLSALDADVDVEDIAADDTKSATGEHDVDVDELIAPSTDTTNTPSADAVDVLVCVPLSSRTLVASVDTVPDTTTNCGLVRILVPFASLLTVLLDVP
jgi:hypothetical protein